MVHFVTSSGAGEKILGVMVAGRILSLALRPEEIIESGGIMQRLILMAGVFLGAFMLLSLQPAFAADEVRYTRFNVHGQSKDGKTAKASYANFTNPGAGHVIVPAGTEILLTAKSSRSFTFTYDNNRKKVVFEYHQPRMGMSVDEYLDKITSLAPISLDDLSELDQKGVEEGRALFGMTRQGVMTALGYPASHRTPSLEAKTWVYWGNRFTTLAVEFDDAGKAIAVPK
jgi:hypothetical protein